MLKLYYSPNSPWSRKVRIVLHEKGIDFVGDAQKEHRDPESFKDINPLLRVPVLEDGSVRLFESDLIIEYLLENYPSVSNREVDSIVLHDRLFREGKRKWGDKEVLSTLSAFGDAIANILFLEREGVMRSEVPYLKRQELRSQACLDWLEERASPEGFIPGILSVQDICLVCWWEWLQIRDVIELSGRPKLSALAKRYDSRPSFAETKPA